MEEAVNNLTRVIKNTMEGVIPKKKPTPHSKRWWTIELSEARTKTKQLARKSYTYKHQPSHPCHDEYRTERNSYSNLIKEQRRNHWISWLEKIGDQDLWTANRFITGPPSDGGKTRVPALRSIDEQGN